MIGLLCCLSTFCSAVPNFNATVKQFCGSINRFFSKVSGKYLPVVLYLGCAVRYWANVGSFLWIVWLLKSFVAFWEWAHWNFANQWNFLLDYSWHLVESANEFLWSPRQLTLCPFFLVGLRVVVVDEAFRPQLLTTEAAVPLKLRIAATRFLSVDLNLAVFKVGVCCGVAT